MKFSIELIKKELQEYGYKNIIGFNCFDYTPFRYTNDITVNFDDIENTINLIIKHTERRPIIQFILNDNRIINFII